MPDHHLPFPAEEIGLRLVLLGRRWRNALDERLRHAGLTDATWRPLVHLRRLPEPPTQRELAALLGIEGPSLVPLLDSLAKAGLIERRPDEHDRRARRIHLTSKGRELASNMQREVSAAESALVSSLSREDQADCARALTLLEGALNKPAQEGRP
ncbi:MarR family transcriptional regulator [Acetobacteraceae bacterium H6797]|nr:MarR family transcriptional regulator [Acetobacteraceae bacterium H6797]